MPSQMGWCDHSPRDEANGMDWITQLFSANGPRKNATSLPPGVNYILNPALLLGNKETLGPSILKCLRNQDCNNGCQYFSKAIQEPFSDYYSIDISPDVYVFRVVKRIGLVYPLADRESDAILREEFANAGLQGRVWQYFTVVPDLKIVGVRDNKRVDQWCVIIRAVNTADAMSATVEEIPYPLLKKLVQRITAEVKGVNRVLYNLTTKPTGTIEREKLDSRSGKLSMSISASANKETGLERALSCFSHSVESETLQKF